MTRRFALGLALAIAATACGGKKDSGGSQQTPTGPSPQQNRAPVINSMSITPTFGIQSLTTFTYAVSASDPDGDSLTYTWDISGNGASGSSGTILFAGGGEGSATVTITDGRGGSVSDSRPFTVGSMTGTWDGSGQGLGDFVMVLTQTQAFITGGYADELGPGQIDPAEPGTIRPDGSLEMRVKQGPFTDWTFRGTMDTTGRSITGQIFGSGFSGDPFVMVKR